MKRILGAASLLSLGLFAQPALAWKCSTLISTITVSPPNITVPRDLPVGSPIGNPISTPAFNAFTCVNNEQGDVSDQTLGPRGMGTFDSMINGRRIYKTNIDGIGYSLSANTAHCGGATATVTGSDTIRGQVDTAKMCVNLDGMIAPTIGASLTVTFYKTATVTGSGTVSARTVGALAMLNNLLLWQNPEPLLNINPFTVTTAACQMSTPSIPVNMGEVDKNEFHGQGSTPGDARTQSFSLPMLCNANTPVNVRMEGDIYDAGQGVFNTTSGPGAASGVGIQLLYNNQPMPLGSDVAVGTTEGGNFSVPLKARYYQTGQTMTPGTANGVLSFTLTYQ
ncbi:fimbrial protein [Enterobacteriaceae bacterium C23F]